MRLLKRLRENMRGMLRTVRAVFSSRESMCPRSRFQRLPNAAPPRPSSVIPNRPLARPMHPKPRFEPTSQSHSQEPHLRLSPPGRGTFAPTLPSLLKALWGTFRGVLAWALPASRPPHVKPPKPPLLTPSKWGLSRREAHPRSWHPHVLCQTRLSNPLMAHPAPHFPALFGPLALLGLLAPGAGPTSPPKRKPAEADVPAPFADYLSNLAARVNLLRINRGERSRQPGIGLIAAALSHAHGFPTYPTDPEERHLMEDILAVIEADPERAADVPSLRARMMAHYSKHPTREGGAHA